MLCSTCNKKPIKSNGLCNTCYMRLYYRNNLKYRKYILKKSRDRRVKFPNERILEYERAKSKPGFIERKNLWNRQYKDIKRFGGVKELVLQRDNYQCVHCHKNTRSVHHKDGQGYYTKNPNNKIDNLETCCQSCHMKISHKDMVRKNLTERTPWNKGLNESDPRVRKNIISIKSYNHNIKLKHNKAQIPTP